MINYSRYKFKHVWNHFTGLCILIWPVILFLSILCLFKIAGYLDFDNFVKITEVLIWPITVLILLYFFKRVVTYLFFSLDEFNFFGTKGELKNVRDLIIEKVNEKFENEKRELDTEKKLDRLQKEVNSYSGITDKSLQTAKEIMSEWKKTIEDNKKLIEENNQLRNMLEKESQPVSNLPFSIDNSEIGTGDKLENVQPSEIQLAKKQYE